MTWSWRTGPLLLCISVLFPVATAVATMPLVLDDPHTIGAGNVEAVLAVASLEQEGAIGTEVPVVDLDIGLLDGLDLALVGSAIHTSFETQSLPIEGHIRASLKWQFLQSDHWNAALNPGFDSSLRSDRENSVVLPLQIEYARGRFAWGFEGDYLFSLEEADQWLAGTYGSFHCRDDLFLLAEVWALGVREGGSTDLGISGGLDWQTPVGPRMLASVGTGIASFGVGRIEWRAYFGLQWNFRLWGSPNTAHLDPHE